jgi:hypothetical protein
LCGLFFAFLAEVKPPLLPPLMQGAEELAIHCPTPWQSARCSTQLREVVSSSFAYDRKHMLVRWLLRLRERLLHESMVYQSTAQSYAVHPPGSESDSIECSTERSLE